MWFCLCIVVILKFNIFHSCNVLCQALETLGSLTCCCYFLFDILSREADEQSVLAYSLAALYQHT